MGIFVVKHFFLILIMLITLTDYEREIAIYSVKSHLPDGLFRKIELLEALEKGLDIELRDYPKLGTALSRVDDPEATALMNKIKSNFKDAKSWK